MATEALKEGDEVILVNDRLSRAIKRSTGELLENAGSSMWTIAPSGDQPTTTRYNGGGLRGQILRCANQSARPGLPTPLVTEGEFASLDEVMGKETLFDHITHYNRSGEDGYSYHYNWPHRQTEAVGLTPEVKRKFLDRMADALRDVPFDVHLLGAHRRFLLYFSPGNKDSQTTYLTLAPSPDAASPFNAEGQLSARYRDHFPPEKVSAAPRGTNIIPTAWEHLRVKPLLYRGPAWAIRFLLDGQDVLRGNRVWVTDDMQFISSDWCQRHNYSTYSSGLDFHNQEFDLPTWITMALAKKAMRDKTFTPKNVEVKHYAVRDADRIVKGTEWGEYMRAARDCLLQLEWLGTYEIPTIYGLKIDPILGRLRAPLSQPLRHGVETRGETIEKGTEVVWQMSSLYRTSLYTVVHWANKNVGAGYSTQAYGHSHLGIYGSPEWQAFVVAFDREISKYPRHTHNQLDSMGQTLYARHLREITAQYKTKQEPETKTLQQLWEPFFKATNTGAQASLRLAGVDEADLQQGRADQTPAVPLGVAQQAAQAAPNLEDIALAILDEDDEEDDEDDGEPFVWTDDPPQGFDHWDDLGFARNEDGNFIIDEDGNRFRWNEW